MKIRKGILTSENEESGNHNPVVMATIVGVVAVNCSGQLMKLEMLNVKRKIFFCGHLKIFFFFLI